MMKEQDKPYVVRAYRLSENPRASGEGGHIEQIFVEEGGWERPEWGGLTLEYGQETERELPMLGEPEGEHPAWFQAPLSGPEQTQPAVPGFFEPTPEVCRTIVIPEPSEDSSSYLPFEPEPPRIAIAGAPWWLQLERQVMPSSGGAFALPQKLPEQSLAEHGLSLLKMQWFLVLLWFGMMFAMGHWLWKFLA